MELNHVVFCLVVQKRQSNRTSDAGLKPVKSTYEDVDDYLDTFEPLLFEEVKAQIAKKDDDEQGAASFFFLLCFFFFLGLHSICGG